MAPQATMGQSAPSTTTSSQCVPRTATGQQSIWTAKEMPTLFGKTPMTNSSDSLTNHKSTTPCFSQMFPPVLLSPSLRTPSSLQSSATRATQTLSLMLMTTSKSHGMTPGAVKSNSPSSSIHLVRCTLSGPTSAPWFTAVTSLLVVTSKASSQCSKLQT